MPHKVRPVTLILKELDIDTQKDYEALIASSEGTNIYHSLEWRDVIKDTWGFIPEYLLAYEGSELIAALPLFLVDSIIYGRHLLSLPVSQYAGVVVKKDVNPDIVREMLDYSCGVLLEKANASFIKLRQVDPLVCESDYAVLHEYNDSSIDLGNGINEIWDKMDASTVKRYVNKSLEAGLELDTEISPDNIKHYIDMSFHTQRRLSLPPYPAQLFHNIFRKLKSHAKLYLAKKDNRYIAGVVVLCSGKTGIYAFSAFLKDRQTALLYPVYFLLWNAIKDSAENGNNIFKLGLSPEGHEDLYSFKRRWATDNRKVYTYMYPASRNRAGLKNNAAKLLLKYSSSSIYKKIGPYLFRQLC